ncbi:MAG: solute carrier family 23 protein, partial [Enterococcus italicus]
FDPVSIILMCIIVIVCMVESTGVYFALAEITDKTLTEDDLKRGYRTEGLAILLGGLVNTFPHTGFSQNVGLVQLSGIKTKRPLYFSAIFLIILGLFPKIGAMAQVIPDAVLGGGMLVMFGMVAVAGMRMLAKVDFTDDRNLLTVALSIGFGLGFNLMPGLFSKLPATIQMFTENGIVMSSLTAVLLNTLFHHKQLSDES